MRLVLGDNNNTHVTKFELGASKTLWGGGGMKN